MWLVLANRAWGEWKECPSPGVRALHYLCETLQGAPHSVSRTCSYSWSLFNQPESWRGDSECPNTPPWTQSKSKKWTLWFVTQVHLAILLDTGCRRPMPTPPSKLIRGYHALGTRLHGAVHSALLSSPDWELLEKRDRQERSKWAKKVHPKRKVRHGGTAP